MTFVGADPAALDALAGQCRGAAEGLDAIQKQVQSRLGTSPWDGPDAAAYRDVWSRLHRRSLSASARDLRAAADTLRLNAKQQREASDAAAGGMGPALVRKPGWPILPGVLVGVVAAPSVIDRFYERIGDYEKDASKINPALVRQLPGLPWAVTTGRQQLADYAGADPAAQATWWSSLEPEQQAALLFAYPGALLALRGLPAEVLTTATKQFVIAMRRTIEVGSVQETASGKVNVAGVEVGAEASAQITQYRNGEAEVTLKLEGNLAKQFGDSQHGGASVGIEGGLTATYRFGSVADANAFVEGLKERLAPDPLRALAKDSAIDYLRMNNSAHQSTMASLAVTAEAGVKVGGMEAKISGAVGGEYNVTTSDKTFFVDGHAELKVGSVGGELSERVEFQLDANNQAKSATITGSLSAHGSVNASELVRSLSGTTLNASAEQASSVSFSATVNPNDPAVQADLVRLAEHPGDPAAIRALLSRSEARITMSTSTSSTAGIDSPVLKLTDKVTSTTNVVTYVKPVSGPWVDVSR